jgi:hypothetical protein
MIKNNWFSVVLLFTITTLNAQRPTCDSAIIRTANMGDAKELMPFPMTTVIANDSIHIFSGHIVTKNSVAEISFIITGKVCNWNSRNLKGENVYKVLLLPERKTAMITCSFAGTGKVIIQYDFDPEPIVME